MTSSHKEQGPIIELQTARRITIYADGAWEEALVQQIILFTPDLFKRQAVAACLETVQTLADESI